MKLKNLSFIVIFMTMFSLVFCQKVFAYIDPGTGSYVMQVIAAAFIGALFSIKMFWKFKRLFKCRILKEFYTA